MTKNFAHRGFSGKYPENTMLAFEKALEIGVDGIELDVQLSKDNEIVIIHDETIDRTTNGKGLVKDFTLKDLSSYDASYIFKDMGFNKIPTLREYFELIKNRNIITNVELKNSVIYYIGLEEKVLELIKEFGIEKNIIISSFNHHSILKFKKLAPNIKCGLLIEGILINAGEYTKKNEVECFHPNFTALNNITIDELKKNSIEINTWTVNKKEDIEYLLSKGIDGIISNYPDLVKEIIYNQNK